jgi:SAM-dependent methyltransferase
VSARGGTGLGTDRTVEPAAAGVVASYEARTRFARAETATVSRPRLLHGLLARAVHVAEIPCGAGHFLADYAGAGLAVTLVDASEAMLAEACRHAHDAGLAPARIHPVRAYVQDLAVPELVDLVVVPNAALNQLACQASLADVLAALRASLCRGVQVLVQVACTHPGAGVDTGGFYDPARQHRVWFADRWFDPAHAGGAVHRRRRQVRDGNRVRIEFDYRDPADACLHAATVELALLSAAALSAAFTAAGFGHVRFLAGQGGLSEALATVGGGRGGRTW